MSSYIKAQKVLFDQLETAFAQGQTPSHVYPLVADYVNDPRLCLTTVSFLPPQLTQKIVTELIEPLKAADPRQYYYPPESLHTTLLTLYLAYDPPQFTPQNIAEVKTILARVIPQFTPITYELKELFITTNGVGIRGYCDEKLKTVVKALQTELKKAHLNIEVGMASDEIFFGHVAIVKFATEPNQAFREKVTELKNIVIGSTTPQEVVLCSSSISLHPKVTTTYQVNRFA